MITLLNLFNNDIWTKFSLFQIKYNKTYTIDEMYARFTIFKNNMDIITRHNSDKSNTFNMTVNQFSDLTSYEFKDMYIGKTYSSTDYGCELFDDIYLNNNYNNNYNSYSYNSYSYNSYSYNSYSYNSYSYNYNNTFNNTTNTSTLDNNNYLNESDIETFDWRMYNVVNPVRNQGQCGSCWAFATTANAESVWAIHTGSLYDLSEQYLVDCATGVGYFNMGCHGGNMDSAFKYMINNKQCNETDYPYVSGFTESKGTCHECNEFTHFSSCYDVVPNNQVSLKMAVLRNPVVIGIEADTYYFQSYSSGILTSELCGTTIDHAVEIVGFGIDDGTKYWTVRNSWGEDWGENGYFRILRTDSTNDEGICGLALEPSFISV
jgi:hypothetical protein